ncbi:hypothetical protein AB0C07_29965 [Actinoplanes missouriensis]|uniref:hypothetical protein n=1 Tax=Actinoplanes missouriensis TaxID=1866 RepID=UPI0033E39B6A
MGDDQVNRVGTGARGDETRREDLMTIYDSTVDAQHNIAASGDPAVIAADAEATGAELGIPAKRRLLPIVMTTAAIAAVTAAAIYGAAKAIEARRSRSRWEQFRSRF